MSVATTSQNIVLIMATSVMLVVAYNAANGPWHTGNLKPGSERTVGDIEASVVSGNVWRRAAFISIGLFGVCVLVTRGGARFALNGSFSVVVALFTMWCFASILWSVDRSLTARRLIVVGASCVMALALARRLSMRDLLALALTASALHLLLDMGLAVGYGTFRPWEADYRFRGFLHPNHEAKMCAVLFLSAMFLARHTTTRLRLAYVTMAALACLFLFLTKSRASIVGTLTGFTAALVLTSSRRAQVGVLLGVATIAPLVLIASGGTGVLDMGISMLEREGADITTMTGRIPLWHDLLEYINERPVFGHGFQSFWNPDRLTYIGRDQGWAISHAHSDYMDLLLGVGAVGLVLYIGVFVLGVRTACRYHRERPMGCYDGVCGLLCYAAIAGLAESIGLFPAIFQLITMSALIHLAFYASYESAHDVQTVNSTAAWDDRPSQDGPMLQPVGSS